MVGFGRDDELSELFERPAVFDKPVGEVVEEFGVGWDGSGAAEVVGIAGEALAEVPGPDAVDDDAGGEGISFGGDPVGEGEAALAFVAGEFGGCHLAERFRGAESSGGDGVADGVDISAGEDGIFFKIARALPGF